MTDHFNTDEFQVPTHEDLFDFEDDVSYSSFSGFSATPATSPTSTGGPTSDDLIGNGETRDPAVNPKELIPSSVGHCQERDYRLLWNMIIDSIDFAR